MKKIMIALAVVAMAVISQAAVVKWGTTAAVKFGGTALGGQEVNLYIVGINGAADQLVDTRTTTASAFGKGSLASNTGTGQSAIDYTSTIAGGALVDSSNNDVGRQYYIVINYNDGTQDYTYTSSAVASSGLTGGTLGTVAFTVNDTIGAAGAKDAWVAASVPEPTSGLLMLVGLAGLALRRRRA